MGLDMFLYKVKRDEVAYWRKANAIHAWFERQLEKNGELSEEGLENCRSYEVSKEDLEELRDTCMKVLMNVTLSIGNVKNGERLNKETNQWEPIYEIGEVIINPELAQELLPTQSGFFFGATGYDMHYVEDLKNTVEQINTILKETDFDKEKIEYLAWW